MSVQAFSQRDPKWSDVRLGVGGGHTLGTAGCAVNGLAAALASAGVDTDPGRLNRWLCRHSGFTQGNLLVFDSLRPLGLVASVVDCYRIPAPMQMVSEALGREDSVLAEVDFSPGGGVNQHWVRVLALEDEDALIHDPWLPPGHTIYWLMARYAHYTWDDPSRAIFRLVFYVREEAPAARALAVPELQHQDRIWVHPSERGLQAREAHHQRITTTANQNQRARGIQVKRVPCPSPD